MELGHPTVEAQVQCSRVYVLRSWSTYRYDTDVLICLTLASKYVTRLVWHHIHNLLTPSASAVLCVPMEPGTRDQRRYSEDHHRKTASYRQRGPSVEPRRRESKSAAEDIRDSGDSPRPKQKSPTTKDEGPLAKYGTVLLAAGLGFGAGLLLADSRKTTPKRQKAAKRSSDSDDRAHSVAGSEERQDQRRLKYRRSSDRLALTGPSVGRRNISRSSRFSPVEELEYEYRWR